MLDIALIVVPAVITNVVFDGGKIWFGVTYSQDKEIVMAELKKLHSEGSYPEKLW